MKYMKVIPINEYKKELSKYTIEKLRTHTITTFYSFCAFTDDKNIQALRAEWEKRLDNIEMPGRPAGDHEKENGTNG